MELNGGIVTYNGKETSVLELSKKYDIKYSTLYGRLFTRHWTVEDAIHGISHKQSDGTIDYNGRKQLVSELAIEYDLKYMTLYNRLFAYHWSVERALNTPVTERHGCSDRGMSEYNAWSDMKARCNRKTHKWYHRYGARGIEVCERWNKSFKNFLDDMGLKPDPSLSLERIDNDGHYELKNCKWATQTEQARNTSTNNMITYRGEIKCITEWREKLGLPRQTIEDRLSRGWSVEEAFETPIKNKKIFLTYNGVTKGLSYWAAKLKVHTGCLRGRLKKGWSAKKIIETKSAKAKILFNGEYKILKEWAKIYDLDRGTIKQRLDKGWSIEKALTHKKWQK